MDINNKAKNENKNLNEIFYYYFYLDRISKIYKKHISNTIVLQF